MKHASCSDGIDKVYVRNLQFNFLKQMREAANMTGSLVLRIVSPDPAAGRFDCTMEVFDFDCTVREMTDILNRNHRCLGPWIRERGVLHLIDHSDETLKELGFVNGDTVCLSTPRCKPFLIHYGCCETLEQECTEESSGTCSHPDCGKA